MESIDRKIVLLLDSYNEPGRMLIESFEAAGVVVESACINDDGFLPEGVTSVYGFFLGKPMNAADYLGKPRYFNQITVPDYWEISGNNSNAKVMDMGTERARIFYTEPANKRHVKVVDWLDEYGKVRYSDHYNKYGCLYARTIFNAKGQKVDKTYFDNEGREIILENFVTGDIILNYKGQVYMFKNKTDFTLFFLGEYGFKEGDRLLFNSLSTPFFVSQRLPDNGHGDILFWQEPTGEQIPGNMKIILDNNSSRTGAIYVQRRNSYDQLISLGASPEMVRPLGYIYSYKRENSLGNEVLICTNSDQLEAIESLVTGLDNMHFNIVAITEMSAKLMSLQKYQNVSLYPGIKADLAQEMFDTCNIYLDINYGGEILSSLQEAYYNNMVIYSFEATCHARSLVAGEHIYAIGQEKEMIKAIKNIDWAKAISLQHAKSMEESVEKYKNIL
ncbi:MAG: accessory Sec system glycosylation chaperone GtfB [Pseudobutyrivibrio sp.]|nr:accessory Sec system glycosylation chaperone GtfB [Pseudobutyrivibrio sp.]